MRAGLAASARWFGCFGPGAACEAMPPPRLRLRAPAHSAARAVTDARIKLVGAAPARLFSDAASGV